MKSFKFTREFYSTVPGMEVDLYKSGDLNGSWMDWRSCLEEVVVSEGLLLRTEAAIMTEYSLESELLQHNIYCYVEES